MKELTLEELTKTRFTTEFTYGGNCCVDGIEDITIPDMNAPTYVGPAIDKLKLYEDLYDQGLLVILPHKRSAAKCAADEAETADEQYINWLENMLVMLSGNFMDLVNALKVADVEALKNLPLPWLTETRKSIRLIAENAEVSNDKVTPEAIECFTNKVIAKHEKNTDKE